ECADIVTTTRRSCSTFLDTVPNVQSIVEFRNALDDYWKTPAGVGVLARVVPLVSDGTGIVAAADIVEEWVQKHQTELHDDAAIRYKKEAWARAVHDRI